MTCVQLMSIIYVTTKKKKTKKKNSLTEGLYVTVNFQKTLYYLFARYMSNGSKLISFFTPQPLRAVEVLFSFMVSGWVGGGKKFVWGVSQKP